MSKDFPFILVHKGQSDYLEVCVYSLTKIYGTNIILIGDSENAYIANQYRIRHEFIDEFYDENWYKNEFGFVYTSYLPENFERFCFVRFNILINFITKNTIDKFIYLDSDIVFLNRNIVDILVSRLRELDVASLSDVSTFCCGWSEGAFRSFVNSFASYFQGEPWGDRHCDMFAFKRFLAEQLNYSRDTTLISNVAAYKKEVFGADPNYSFSPFLMKITGVWDYRLVAQIEIDCNSFIHRVDGIYGLVLGNGAPFLPLDFVHLNGSNKTRVGQFRNMLDEQ